MTAVLTTSDSPREAWQVEDEDALLSHHRIKRPLSFELGPHGKCIVHGLQGPPPTWIYTALNKLNELSALPVNWDGYGGMPLSSVVVVPVLNLLGVAFVGGRTPFPGLVPTSQGGVQVEWHVAGLDLEIEFMPSGGMEVYFCDEATGQEWEGDLRNNLDRLGQALKRLQ